MGLSTVNETSQLSLNVKMGPKMKTDIGHMLKDFVCHDKEILWVFFNGTGELLKAFMSERKGVEFVIWK